jgi:hypothetical protein
MIYLGSSNTRESLKGENIPQAKLCDITYLEKRTKQMEQTEQTDNTSDITHSSGLYRDRAVTPSRIVTPVRSCVSISERTCHSPCFAGYTIICVTTRAMITHMQALMSSLLLTSNMLN